MPPKKKVAKIEEKLLEVSKPVEVVETKEPVQPVAEKGKKGRPPVKATPANGEPVVSEKVEEKAEEKKVDATAEKGKRGRQPAKAAPTNGEPVSKPEEKKEEKAPESAPVAEKGKRGRPFAKAVAESGEPSSKSVKSEEKEEEKAVEPAPLEDKPKRGKKPAGKQAEVPASKASKPEEKSEIVAEPAPVEKGKRGKKGAKAVQDEEPPSKVSKVEEKEEEAAEPATVEEKPKRGRKQATKGTTDTAGPAGKESKPEEKEEATKDEPAPVEEKAKRGRKPAKAAAAAEDGEAPAKKSKADKVEEKSKLRKEASVTDGMDFSHKCKTKDGREPDLKIASWNINGIRAWMDKGGLSYLRDEKPDILCVQETKCALADMPSEVKVDGYYSYWSSADQAGYAGTGIYSKTEPIKVTFGIGQKKHDSEGRVITAEYEKFYLVNAYVPNSGRGLPRLPYRSKEWDVDFRAHLNNLNKTKPVIMCGDLNVAHQEIDLANPKTNRKTAGFTDEERQGFTDLLAEGYIDSFRELHPDVVGAYSFWTYMGNARGKNVGWRLDYFVLSERLREDLCDNVIRKDVMGSDHCPIVLFMALK